jgi:carboxypeptidase family protein/TonB-dependent receptor-like protein
MSLRPLSALLIAGLLAACAAAQQVPRPTPVPPARPQPPRATVVYVQDENGRAVAGARVTVRNATQVLWLGDADYSGRVLLPPLPPGHYQVIVEREGYYRSQLEAGVVPAGANYQVTLAHVQEFHESVTVTDSAPAVDPQKTSQTEQLTNREIFSLPYPSTRDFKNVLPFMPQVIQETSGQVHVAGSPVYETLDLLDGFNVTDPVTGAIDVRVSPDALRLIDLQVSRYSPEFGKGAGGVLRLESGMGDDHFRFAATNFLPGLNFRNGITWESFTPRLTLSGPLRKGKAWWFEGVNFNYDFNINKDLPAGQRSNPEWFLDSLSKAQINLSNGNILTNSFLLDHDKAEKAGLSLLTPPGSTTDRTNEIFMYSVKDSATLWRDTLLETGFAVSRFTTDQLPRGAGPFIETPNGVSGSFFETLHTSAWRYQGLANLFLAPWEWHGRHELKLGTDFEDVSFDEQLARDPISFLRTDGTLARLATFTGGPPIGADNFMAAFYAQDRWSATDRMLIEYGARLDWDTLLRQAEPAPRLSGTYVLSQRANTKLAAGVGLTYDVTNLDLLARGLEGSRTDQFFAANGITPLGPPLVTTLFADPRLLSPPRSLNWSIGVEQMLPWKVYFRTDFIEKRGKHAFAYFNPPTNPAGVFTLASAQNIDYDSVEFTAHKRFAATHEVFVSYTRSDVRSNAAVDFSLENPLFGQQLPGPLPWDAPNRLISWGWFPLTHRFDFAYSFEWHTGFPFNVVNASNALVGLPDRTRFPDLMTLDVHLEHRFKFRGYEWAIRAGFNNVTGRDNPAVVNNNIDSPEFLTFSTFQHRVFTGRIRLLGKH